MKLLLIGDVVGKPGRAALLDRLQDLQEQHAIDFTVMNAENVAGGVSITATIAELLFSSGIDVRSEEHTSELQAQSNLGCRLLLEKKKNIQHTSYTLATNLTS